ncbi:hypothetical protein RND71_017751 [Anisodus tanguticus]|uniref:Uncharacterized protein n=1 Tax=Anisodus tanguticus TaxID=243964 RepID=A0AAE1S2Z8_9SOLA|nr:hypothetical protein RND71_017751 [Anisodus tanguticus]
MDSDIQVVVSNHDDNNNEDSNANNINNNNGVPPVDPMNRVPPVDPMLGHNERNCVQRSKDELLGTLKNDQFGIWLKAEIHGVFSGNHKREGVHTTEGRVRNRNSNLIEGKKVAGTTKSLLHLEEGAASTNTQSGTR